jgi:hypothetical protein
MGRRYGDRVRGEHRELLPFDGAGRVFRNYRVVFLSDATATYDYPDCGFGAISNELETAAEEDFIGRRCCAFSRP